MDENINEAESKRPRYNEKDENQIGQKLMFCALCEVFEQIEATTKRLIIADILRDFFVHLMSTHPQELPVVVHLCLSRLGPEYEGLELGVGEALLMKAISQSTGKSLKHIKTEVETRGDLGLVAQNCKSTQSTLFKPMPLSIQRLFAILKEIAQATGANVSILLIDCRRTIGEWKKCKRCLRRVKEWKANIFSVS